ncbi:unnamed protein product [Ambrosiozyma monospora]|uniref:Unnamed protein product n=1 Tax=Ambrosiozyma monospora TaxID=43982 RepID=A0ACB5TWR3_AMBMO|nr:unnamed protein product [Ambrosiozyma monospora]
MEVYNQFIEPSSCLQSLYCNFTSPEARNLIISKGTSLQVFQVIETESKEKQQVNAIGLETKSSEALDNEVETFINKEVASPETYYSENKLSLIAEYRINGEIVNLTKFKSVEDETVDYLIISTRVAKLSIVKWDVENHCISTVSLHYYEPSLDCLSTEELAKSQIRHRTDPNNLCTSIEINEQMMMAMIQLKNKTITNPSLSWMTMKMKLQEQTAKAKPTHQNNSPRPKRYSIQASS